MFFQSLPAALQHFVSSPKCLRARPKISGSRQDKGQEETIFAGRRGKRGKKQAAFPQSNSPLVIQVGNCIIQLSPFKKQLSIAVVIFQMVSWDQAWLPAKHNVTTFASGPKLQDVVNVPKNGGSVSLKESNESTRKSK